MDIHRIIKDIIRHGRRSNTAISAAHPRCYLHSIHCTCYRTAKHRPRTKLVTDGLVMTVLVVDGVCMFILLDFLFQ
jgi:hypothetical protein